MYQDVFRAMMKLLFGHFDLLACSSYNHSSVSGKLREFVRFGLFSLRIAIFLWTLKIIPDDLEIRAPKALLKAIVFHITRREYVRKLLGLIRHNMYSRLPPTFSRIRWNLFPFYPHRSAENNPELIAKFVKRTFSCKLFHIMNIASIIPIPFRIYMLLFDTISFFLQSTCETLIIEICS